MKVCPLAVVASCKTCPFFRICPLKGVLGDYVAPKPAERPAPVTDATK